MPSSRFKQDFYRFVAGPLGHLEGITVSSSSKSQPLIHYFGGLPYALPPVGPYRFRKARRLPDNYRYGTKATPGNFTGHTAVCPQPTTFKDSGSEFFEENCLQLNIYIPAGKPPPGGWPVFFYIHGGFLQWGSANSTPEAMTLLLSETALKAIVVKPAYRVNLFGFLASKELDAEAQRVGERAGNMGFWDQRTALEWTGKNIGFFGGDANNITVGGYSAGSHSAFHQLAHELYFVSDDKALIKRTIMWSNSPGVQPRTASEHQAQFEEVLHSLGISSSLSAKEKLKKLRETSIEDLCKIQNKKMRLSEFRATSDGAFVSKSLMSDINGGDFAQRMKKRGIKLMNGECRDEHTLYQAWRTPSSSYEAVRTRLIADYPETAVNKLMYHYCGNSKALPSGIKDWPDLFGRLYADMQVHDLERGFHRALELGGLEFGKDVLRYRFDWKAKCTDAILPPEWGVTHSSDMAIWFWGLDNGDGLTESEKEILHPWNKAFAAFVHGDDPQWGTKNIKEMKRLRADGQTDVWTDNQFEKGVAVWNIVNGGSSAPMKSKL